MGSIFFSRESLFKVFLKLFWKCLAPLIILTLLEGLFNLWVKAHLSEASTTLWRLHKRSQILFQTTILGILKATFLYLLDCLSSRPSTP